MSKILKKLGVLTMVILSVMVLRSCSIEDDDTSTSDQVTIAEIKNSVQAGTWKISKYIDSGSDETSNFSSYTFSFGSGNVLTATNGTNTYTGTWSVTDSNSNDDSQDDVHFNIMFSTPTMFVDLSDDWNIVSKSSTQIELIDVSGGNGGTDYLTFVKN